MSFVRLARLALCLLAASLHAVAAKKNLIVDTDLFSDVDDAGALLLAATSPDVNLLAVNINYPSSYSAVCASGILAHYNKSGVPIGIIRPLTNATFFDSRSYALGEYASKVAFHFSGGSIPWGEAERAWDPVALYRKVLAEAEDGSVTVVSIGFLDNLSGLLNSTADAYSHLTGAELARRKVSELVIMGGSYPSGRSWNFWGSNPSFAAHVIHSWQGRVVFSGGDVGLHVLTGGPLMDHGPKEDPVRQAYIYYTFWTSRSSWDPLAVLYAIHGLGSLFEFGAERGYNRIEADGANRWVDDGEAHNQFVLRLKARNETAAKEVDRLFLRGARSAARTPPDLYTLVMHDRVSYVRLGFDLLVDCLYRAGRWAAARLGYSVEGGPGGQVAPTTSTSSTDLPGAWKAPY